jgi:hypothetical protein
MTRRSSWLRLRERTGRPLRRGTWSHGRRSIEERVEKDPRTLPFASTQMAEMPDTSALQSSWAAFKSVRKWDNLSLRIAVYYVQVMQTERITRDGSNAGRNRGFNGSGWRKRWKTELSFIGRDSESSPKPS